MFLRCFELSLYIFNFLIFIRKILGKLSYNETIDSFFFIIVDILDIFGLKKNKVMVNIMIYPVSIFYGIILVPSYSWILIA